MPEGSYSPGSILVTGASGFVGAAVTRDLQARGFPPRIIVRADSSRENFDQLDLDIAVGDLRDPVAVEQAMQGVDTLFHVAADYRLWAKNPQEIVDNNRLMTQVVMQAALKARVKRIVYTSSVATLAPATEGMDSNETRKLSEAQAIGAYKRSKVVAERVVEAMIAQENLPAVIVHPSTPIGPRDIKPTPTGRIILEAAKGRIPAFVDTGLNLVHVDDVAQGHWLALQKGEIGEHYILGGQNVPLSQMLAEIAELCGRKPPTLRLPRRALFPIAYLSEAIASFTGKQPLTTVDGLKMARYMMYYSSQKAMQKLGYQPRPYIEALREAIDWMHSSGRLS